jgi:type IV pilus biogenesis protein CpaD/CtpE
MKKILVFIMALVMALGLAACGGVDKEAVTEVFNNTNTELNTVVTFANDNLDKMDQVTADSITELINAMAAFKAEIESDDLSQDRADEIIAELKNYPDKIAEMKTKVDTLIEGGGTGVTEEQVAALLQLAQSLADIHAKFAEYYDSFNDETKDFVDEIALMVNDINSVLDGSIGMDSVQADEFIQGSQDFYEAAVQGWAEIEAQLAE